MQKRLQGDFDPYGEGAEGESLSIYPTRGLN